MLSTIFTLLAFAIAAQTAPAPAPSTNPVSFSNSTKKSSFSLPASRNPSHVRNGTAALLQAYRKFNIKPTLNMPPEFMRALLSRSDPSPDTITGSTPASNAHSFYTVPVDVGGQVLDLNFDTGSADL